MKLLYVIFILVVLQNELITNVELLTITSSDNSVGNCSKLISFMETVEVPYLETYKEKTWGIFFKTRVRWNYKIESRKSWRLEYECCDGFERKYYWDVLNSKLYSKCEPFCRPPCGNGTCTKTNVCLCNVGYFFVDTKTSESDVGCAPICSVSCIHGKCVLPDTCMCDSGYKLTNSSYICEPICHLSCPTGSYCYKPDQCLCLDGYKNISSDVELTNMCEPICERECVHGKCTAPNVCTCDDGYELDIPDLFTCKPKCERDCLYGECTAPNVCTCNEGYSLNTSNVCEPVCSEACVMGTCVAPESCSCFAGYGLLENSKYICEPVCEKACLNGRCTAPGVCMCNEGFQLSGDETEEHICKPYCETSCEPFGVCTAPNVCSCFSGYRLANKTEIEKINLLHFSGSVCEPICLMECINGFCSAPFTCSCIFGYQPINNYLCLPTCSQRCVNGFCAAPEACKCDSGYRLSNSWYECQPICETDCINGYCTAPNKCICNSGYQPTEGNRTSLCEPICNPSCKNGICVQPDVCSCNPGYRSSMKSKVVCDPICHPACETNGICEAPDLCVCKDGYRMVYYDGKNVPFGCEPICGVECGNGTCTAPDLCTCFDGYRNAEIGGCEPVCSTCSNGTCVAPEVCECNDGFVPANPNLGFGVKSSRSSVAPENRTRPGSRCLPHCENCDNGECMAPGECRCYAGFVKVEGTCVHACQDGCGTHGECVEEYGTCECYYGWTGLQCNRPTLCVLILKDGDNRTEQLKIIEEKNTTIEHILKYNPACIECIHKINNETMCFKMFGNNTENEAEIGCLMNEECLPLSNLSQYEKGEMIKVISGIIGGILLLTAITIYVVSRKRRSSQLELAPNYCITCLSGYELINFSYECKPKCDSGYVFDETNQTCKPNCSMPCGLHEECNACKPICDFECINGMCTAPNVCTCNRNHYPLWIEPHSPLYNSSLKRICRPLLGSRCTKFSCGVNEICHESGICICNDGYVRGTAGDCVPYCYPACSNGTCTAPNRCECHDGFALQYGIICNPICERGCKNGDCIGPNKCICRNDFVLNLNHHLGPECIPECIHRNCSERGDCVVDHIDDIDITYKCACYRGWTGQDCEQPTMCMMVMPDDYEDLNSITIHNDSAKIDIRFFENMPYCECDKSIDNETLCYMQYEGNTFFISCLFNKDLPCYMTSHYNTSITDAKIIWSFVTVIIVVAIGLTAKAYFIYRKRQKEKLVAIFQNLSHITSTRV
ncbi:von Willebrand factor D and EGF domain-containing protein [Cyphomyrmex costatus]|uniref:von Willebrand factor D and EGF domain-containing protein n=1 Tax=Cyphomyrmex costatus TaxID=456900 RepID=A0A195CXR6_9HYME|nr:von Willebrand factor D and EGF domain-containing protein [Cyphomyrmex costatus]